MSNLSNNIQNIEASRSTIEDADFAAEAADLAKNQILAQSAYSYASPSIGYIVEHPVALEISLLLRI